MVGYYEAGPYLDYNKSLYAIIKGLMKFNWIDDGDPPLPTEENGRDIWKWVSTSASSRFLEFPNNAYYTSNWNTDERARNVPELIKRLNIPGSIDILLSPGTQAGKDLSNNNHHTPTLVLTSSNPVAAGLIKNEDDRPFGHIHITVDPNRDYRQVLAFYNFTSFKNLGVIFEDSKDGRSYSSIQIIKNIEAEKGFNVVECHSLDETYTNNQSEREESVIKCLDKLTGKIDALYLTQQGGVNKRTLPVIIKWAIKNKIKTFSQAGADEVKQGILMSMLGSSFKLLGEFEARNIILILKGTPVTEITQVFVDPSLLSLNTHTAELIGLTVPSRLMGVVEEIFQ